MTSEASGGTGGSDEVAWDEVQDGEYNEVSAIVNGREIAVFSNRDGDSWDYRVDDEESVSGYDTKEEAQQAAIKDANE